MKLNVNNLLKALWPAIVITVWSLYMFGTTLLSFTTHALALCYIIVLPYIIGDIVQKDTEE